MSGVPVIPINFKAKIPKDKITAEGFFVEPIGNPEAVIEYVDVDVELFDFGVSPVTSSRGGDSGKPDGGEPGKGHSA